MKIRLQSVGLKNAIPAEEMRGGDVRMYNFGATELVIKVIEKSEKTLTVISYCNDSKKYYIYDIRKTTPVVIVKRNQDVSIHKPQQAEKVSGRNKGMIDVSEYFKDVQTQETQEQPQQMDNTATKKQRYALYIASNRKIDTRNIVISKEKASELISRSMNGEDITNELQAIVEGKQTETVTKQAEETKQEHNNQQAEERQEVQEQTQKIKVKSITFLWSESNIIKDNTTVSTWTEANKVIKDVAFSIDTEGYRKTAFRIEWVDGGKYEGRIDVMAKDWYKNAPLSEHIENYALGMAGMKKPYQWTQERYENYLNALKINCDEWKTFLNTYMLYDEETPKSPTDPSNQSDKHNNSAENSELATIVAEEAQPLEVLFYHEDLSEAQNAKINEILNRHKDSNKFTFVAVYQRQNEAKQAVLHVKTNEGKDLYMSFLLDGSFAFSSRELDYYDHHVYGIKLLHEFTNNSDNMQKLDKEQEEKAVNDTMQETENANNTNKMNKSDNLQEEQGTMQEEAEKLNDNEQAQTLQFTYKINDEKNGIELYFSDKPSEAIKEQLKQMGFKWSPMRSIWYAKKTDERLHFVLSLLSDSYNSELTEEQRKTLSKRLEKDNVMPLRLFKCKNTSNILLECINTNLTDQKPFYFLIFDNGQEAGKGYDDSILNDYTLIYTYVHNSEQENEPITYPDINIDDIETYVIDKKLQEAENAGHWIFRTKERNHTKEIQNFFASYNNKVLEVLEQTDNERIKYYLKKSLQSFKKRYFDNYVRRLRNKANNPSWIVTGRGGLNVRKYNKALNQYDKLMQEAIELTKQMDRVIERAKDEIRRDKEQRIKEAVKSIKNDLTFRVVTKEVEYMGMKQRKRVYIYNDYWTAKLWNAYRIFKGTQEIYTLKTTQGLEDAKQYIAYLVQQESQKVS
jgi:hypothetical protein